MTTTVNIANLNKLDLLKALWVNQPTTASVAASECKPPVFDRVEAKRVLDSGDYIDYFCGRAIKTDLSTTSVNPRFYDRDAGEGTFARVVNKMRHDEPHV